MGLVSLLAIYRAREDMPSPSVGHAVGFTKFYRDSVSSPTAAAGETERPPLHLAVGKRGDEALCGKRGRTMRGVAMSRCGNPVLIYAVAGDSAV